MYLLLMVVVATLIIFATTSESKKEKRDAAQFDEWVMKREVLVGRTVVVQRDTLLLTYYDRSYDTYHLSNGVMIDAKLAMSLVMN